MVKSGWPKFFFDGNRYEVGPTTIPFELVAAASEPEVIESGDITLTKEIALKLADRISVVSFYLLVDDDEKKFSRYNEASMSNNKNDSDHKNSWDAYDDDDDVFDANDVDSCESAEDLISRQLAASLRWSHHHILRACTKGLQDWAKDQES